MFSKRIQPSGASQRLAVTAAFALILSPIVIGGSPASGSGAVEVVNIDFTAATATGSSVVNTAAGRIEDVVMVGSPTGLNSADGLTFTNAVLNSTSQRLTGKLGGTSSMSQIVVEMVAKFPDAGCAAQAAGSMVFSLGRSGSYVPYNIYRHSGFIGFNTFFSDIYGVAIPSTTSFHSYKFVMLPRSQGFATQEIWIDGVQQTLDYRTTSSAVSPCSTIIGTRETDTSRVFTGGTGSYTDGSFMLMTHALSANQWGTSGSVRSLKITTTGGSAPPSAPSISAITASSGQLSVAFTAPTSTGGAAISNYEYSTNDGSNWTTRSPDSTVSPIVIPSLNNGTSYQVRIRAVNSVGNGTQSSAVTGTPAAPASTPGAPTISGITAGDTQLSVAFSAPSSDGGASITNYDYSVDDGANWVTPSTPSTASPIVITGLTNSTSYPVKIRARNSAGGGTASNAVSATPLAATPPPSSSPGSAAPPTPPTAKVSGISIKPSNSSKSSMLTLKLNAPPVGSEQVSVVVRLLDLNGKLIQELTIPVNSTTSTLEVPVNLPIGTFTVSAGTSTPTASSQAMTMPAATIKKSWLASPSPDGTLRLAGKAASSPIFFAPNSISLSNETRGQLRKAAKVAKRSNSRVAVTGFAANSGMGTAFEKYVAERRALAVTRFLKAQGVSSWLFYSGFDGAKTAEFSGQPRRVEIRILK